MFSHVAERYFPNTPDTYVIGGMAEGLMRSLVVAGPKLMSDLTNYDYRAEIMWAGTVAHNDMAGVGREQDWATHDSRFEEIKVAVVTGGGVTTEEIQRYERVTVEGTMLMCREFVKMCTRQQRGGHIVNTISKTVIRTSGDGNPIYAATKGAVLALTKNLAAEVGRRGIYVNGIVPGYVAVFLCSEKACQIMGGRGCFRRNGHVIRPTVPDSPFNRSLYQSPNGFQ